jgi:hypothetical protein
MLLLALILSMPTENATARMRAWRALKASGAAVLRDGVYLLPRLDSCRDTLDTIAADVQSSGGVAHVLAVETDQDEPYRTLYDRSADYATLMADIDTVRAAMSADTIQDAIKQLRKLRKVFAAIAEIDFFPGESKRQADDALKELELSAARVLAPDEPYAVHVTIRQLDPADYLGRTWATRRRPWVDRLASAWLIRRFIDPAATLLWLASPVDCPGEALGFDFDGATFSHVGTRVTFEVLQASFQLDGPALRRLGVLVHYLDVGGVQPPEAAGIESVLAGMRDAIADDDQLLAAASTLFDGLLASFERDAAKPVDTPA